MFRVMIVLTSNQLSGAEKRFLRLLGIWSSPDILLAINHELLVQAEATDEFRETVRVLREERRLEIIPMDSLYSTTKCLVRIIRQRKVAMVHSVLSYIPSVLASVLSSRPMIFEVTSPDVVQWLVQGRRRYTLGRVARFHAVSPSVAERFKQALYEMGCQRLTTRIETAPIPLFVPPEGVVDRAEKENLVVFAARMVARKNPILFATVTKELIRHRQDWKVAILGRGPLRDDIASILRDELAEQKVELAYVPNPYSYFQRSKIFVSLVYPDNYPSQSVLEAMYCSNALVLTNGGYSRRFIDSEAPNGYLVDYQADAVLNALMEMTEDTDLTLQMGRRSKEHLEHEFAKERYLEHLQSLYEEVLAPSAR